MPYGNLEPTYIQDQDWEPTVLAPKEMMNWVKEAPVGTFDHYDAEGTLLDYSTVTMVNGQVNVGTESDKEIAAGRRRADDLARAILDEYNGSYLEEAREATIRDFEVLKCFRLWKFKKIRREKLLCRKTVNLFAPIPWDYHDLQADRRGS